MCSLVNSSIHSTDVGNLSVKVLLKLPTGETVPAVVVIPKPTPTIAGTVLSHGMTTVSSEMMQLVPDGPVTGMVSYAGQVSSQPLLSLNSQAPLGLPAVVCSGTVTSTYSQPGAVFDLQESGLTALGIAASTREVCITWLHLRD